MHMFWDTPIVKASLWQLPIVSTAFKINFRSLEMLFWGNKTIYYFWKQTKNILREQIIFYGITKEQNNFIVFLF